MREVVEEQTQRHAHHQGRCKPAVEDERQEVKACRRQHDHHKNAALQPPLHQLPAAPETTLKEKPLVIEKSRSDQPERPERADDVIRVVLRVIHMGVMLKMHPREDGKAEPKQQRRAMAHGLIDPSIGMGRVVAGVMNHRPFQVQRQKARAQQHRQGQSRHKPAPDGQSRQGITAKKEPNSGVPDGRWINEFARNRSVAHSNRTRLLLLSSALVHPEVRQQVCKDPEPR